MHATMSHQVEFVNSPCPTENQGASALAGYIASYVVASLGFKEIPESLPLLK